MLVITKRQLLSKKYTIQSDFETYQLCPGELCRIGVDVKEIIIRMGNEYISLSNIDGDVIVVLSKNYYTNMINIELYNSDNLIMEKHNSKLNRLLSLLYTVILTVLILWTILDVILVIFMLK